MTNFVLLKAIRSSRDIDRMVGKNNDKALSSEVI